MVIGLNNTQNNCNSKYLKWCLVRYLNPADHDYPRIKKIDKKLDFKDKNFPVEIRDFCKREKCISNIVFSYKNREKLPIYVSNNTFKRHVDLLFLKKYEGQSLTTEIVYNCGNIRTFWAKKWQKS